MWWWGEVGGSDSGEVSQVRTGLAPMTLHMRLTATLFMQAFVLHAGGQISRSADV